MVEIGGSYHEVLQELFKLYSCSKYEIINFGGYGYAAGASGGICYVCRDRCEDGDLLFRVEEPIIKISGVSFGREIYYSHKKCINFKENNKVLNKELIPAFV